jgi:hypothetical protein
MCFCYTFKLINLVNLPILDISGDLAKFSMIYCFVVKLVITKVVDNLYIYLLFKFGGILLCSLGDISV